MSTIGKLEPVPVRELWAHEERGFSAWLETNLDVLSEAIGVTLADPQRELLAGSFQVDLVAEDENGDRVIVENQLEGVLLHAQRSPSKDSWISVGAGVRSGVSFIYVVWMTEESAVEVYIDTGDKDENKRIFDGLYAKSGD